MKKKMFTTEFRNSLTAVVDELGLLDVTSDEVFEKGIIELVDPIASTEDYTSMYVMRENGTVSRTMCDGDIMTEAVYLNNRTEGTDEIIDATAYEQFGLVITSVINSRV